MDELIQIKCPFDGAVLKVKNQPGIEGKNVTCPICKNTYPFTEFRRLTPVKNTYQEDPDTELPGKEENTHYKNYGQQDEKTKIQEGSDIIGTLLNTGNGDKYDLRLGHNVVGRKASKSTATISIDTGDKKAMSREHLVIDVKNVPGKGIVHYVSLAKEKVNKTYIGDEELQYGDCLVLNDGDLVRLPDATLKFVILDPEGTDF